MNDFRVTPPRNAMMIAQRDNVARRNDSPSSPRAEGLSFNATLQRSASREQATPCSNEGNGTRPGPPAADQSLAPDPTATAVRPSAARPEPDTTDDSKARADTRPGATRSLAHPAGQGAAAAVATAAATAAAAAAATATADGETNDQTVTERAPADDSPAHAAEMHLSADPSTAALPLTAGDPSVTAGLIAASISVGIAAAARDATPPIAGGDADGEANLRTTAAVGDTAGNLSHADAVKAGSTATAAPRAAVPIAESEIDSREPLPTVAGLTETAGRPGAADSRKTVGGNASAVTAGTLPEPANEPIRSPGRDRLMQDFEQRFESSLARAIGTPGGGAAAGSPLLLAGLPPQPPTAPVSSPIAHASLATPLAHPAFGDDLAHRVLLFAGQRVQSAEITLTPADLGPIRVSIELRGQEAAVQFNAAHAATRSAIEDALPRLREMLAAQGLQLAQADIGDRAPRDPRGGRGSDGSQPRPGVADARPATAGAVVVDAAAGATGSRRLSLIDIRV